MQEKNTKQHQHSLAHTHTQTNCTRNAIDPDLLVVLLLMWLLLLLFRPNYAANAILTPFALAAALSLLFFCALRLPPPSSVSAKSERNDINGKQRCIGHVPESWQQQWRDHGNDASQEGTYVVCNLSRAGWAG